MERVYCFEIESKDKLSLDEVWAKANYWVSEAPELINYKIHHITLEGFSEDPEDWSYVYTFYVYGEPL